MTDRREPPVENFDVEPSGETVEPDVFFPEQDDDSPPPTVTKQPLGARGMIIVGARAAVGTIGATVAVVAVAAASFLPLPEFRLEPPNRVVTPVPTAQQLVCPGAILRLADRFGQDATTPSPIGQPATQYASSSGPVDRAPLEQSDARTEGSAAAPTIISTPPNETKPSEQVLLSGAQAQLVNETDYVGLAAAHCASANGDSWLVGGSTSVGRTTLLTLSNPTEVAATVNLELFGDTGAIVAPGTSGIIVPPRGQRVLSLAGFKPDVRAPVVHVKSTGGQVAASLQQSTVRGLSAGGVDITGPSAGPSVDNVIPGLRITDVAAVQNLLSGGESFLDLEPELRLFAPGEGPVTAKVTIIPENSEAAANSNIVEFDAGRVVDLPIGDLEDGSYSVRVESETPLVSAVRVSAAKEAATDFAWLSAVAELDKRAQITIAPGPAPMLHLTNTHAEPAEVTLTNGGGTTTITIAPGQSVATAVQPNTSYQLSGFERLYGAVSFAEGGGIARYPAQPPGAGSTPIVVFG